MSLTIAAASAGSLFWGVGVRGGASSDWVITVDGGDVVGVDVERGTAVGMSSSAVTVGSVACGATVGSDALGALSHPPKKSTPHMITVSNSVRFSMQISPWRAAADFYDTTDPSVKIRQSIVWVMFAVNEMVVQLEG